jgi:acetyl-CoA decarbonylase/synthase complex subunit gamma
MALTGLEIYKLLPKTNCGDCGVPTCMAFAMKLAQKKAELSECPHASEEAKAKLGAAGEPPIRLVRIGPSPSFEAGGETVLFRHEKTFFHPTGVALELRTSEGAAALTEKIGEMESYRPLRVGEELRVNLYFLTHDSPHPGDFIDALDTIKRCSNKGLILDCPDKELLCRGLEILANGFPAIFLRRKLQDSDIALAKKYDASLVLRGDSLEDLAEQSARARGAGVGTLLLNLETPSLGDQLQGNTILRRSALKKNFRPFGYPLLTFLRAESKDHLVAQASALLCKYSSVLVLPEYDRALLYTLLTLRQNIFTDPQKPIQVDAGLYPIGEPGPESAVFVTTNFSLTYFIVSGEIENSGLSAHLLVVDTEGQSVLTAWAAGKFGGAKIAKFVKEIKLEERVKTRKIVIPGLVARISGELEENLPGWGVIVGCQEASDISSFVRSVKLT